MAASVPATEVPAPGASTAVRVDAPDLSNRPRLRGLIHKWSFAGAPTAGAALIAAASFAVSAAAGLAAAVYSIAITALFGVSALYHRTQWRRLSAQKWAKRADHSMIFLFIAGSYTPFAVLALPHGDTTILGMSTRMSVLAVVWTGAFAGVTLKMIWPSAPRTLGVALYLALGWVIVLVAPTLIAGAGWAVMILLISGGVLYSIGGIIYGTQLPNPWPSTFGYHEIFHALTVAAALCHYAAVWVLVLRA